MNPYIAGSPVTGTDMFFGREDVFAFIKRNLVGQHRDAPLVLYGQRRTGKTSVLYQLHRQLDSRYRCVLIDLHGLNLSGMGNLMFGIAGSISRGLRRDHQITTAAPIRGAFLADPRAAFEAILRDAVWPVLGTDHLVLMMDEVIRLDEEVRAGRLEREIFEYLRHLMQHHDQLNFIFSLGSGLEDLKKDYAFLFSVALYHRISFLEPDAALRLITEPVRGRYELTPRATGKILKATSGHPYYTQLLCHCLFDSWLRTPRSRMDVPDLDAAMGEAVELGSANLTYVWEDSTAAEQALMAGIAAATRRSGGAAKADHARREWRAERVSLPDREVSQALRSLVSREVIAGDEAYEFTVDLQRLWLEKHRRLDWVKGELADSVLRWNSERGPRAGARGRWLALAGALAVVGTVVALLIAAHHPVRHQAGAGHKVAASSSPPSPEREAAERLSVLLAESVSDRAKVDGAAADVSACGPALARDPATFRMAAAMRQRLLGQLASMPGAASLPPQLIVSLTQAWHASLSADTYYASWAQDLASGSCTPSDYSDANFRAALVPDHAATASKSIFAMMWNPIASRYGLTTYEQTQL